MSKFATKRANHKAYLVASDAATYSASVVDMDVHLCAVVFRYLRIDFTASQCFMPGLDIKRLTTPTANVMSGRVATIAYMRLPTAAEA